MDSSNRVRSGLAVGEILSIMPLLTKTRLPNGDLKSDQDHAAEIYAFLDEYRLRQMPSMPDIVKEYYDYDWKHIVQMNREPDKFPKFWFNPVVKEYFDTRDSIVAINERNLKVLRWLRHHYINDADKVSELDSMIYPFLEFKFPQMKHDGRILLTGLQDINWPLFNFKITEDYGTAIAAPIEPEHPADESANAALDVSISQQPAQDSIWEE